MKLSILCVSTGKDRAQPFFDHFSDLAAQLDAELVLAIDGVHVHSKGYIESVLDEAIALTHGDYVLRLDDDERCSPAMITWLRAGKYLDADHWTFPRAHFYGNAHSVVCEDYYFPDLQTRLSVREKAGGRSEIHAGSPFGAGMIARVCIEHWVYLVKSYEERREIARGYQRIRAGADGGEFRAGGIEDEHPNGLHVIEYNGGYVPMRGAVSIVPTR